MQLPSSLPPTSRRPWFDRSVSVPSDTTVALDLPKLWQIFAAAAFLVSIPVFFQAALVREQPLVSLGASALWFMAGWQMRQRRKLAVWGDLLIGFSWSWLAGSIYWGWWRSEPLIHLPIESIGIPFALWGMRRTGYRVGALFYLGSLFGTAMGDLYFYLTDLIPYWRQVMAVEPSVAPLVLQNALTSVQTPWGVFCAIALGTILLAVGLGALQKPQAAWWAFAGAVLSTIAVEGLFAVAAALAL